MQELNWRIINSLNLETATLSGRKFSGFSGLSATLE